MIKSIPTAVAAGALALSAVPFSSTADARPAPAMLDLVDTAVSAGRFDTLVAAVQAAGLESALKGPGPFTIFAPTDDAFAKLPPATIQYLLNPDNVEVLTDILTYHVVPGNVLSGTVVTSPALDTLSGQRVDVSLQAGAAFVDDARILSTDVLASNGVIHVIDTVLLPSFSHVLRTADAASNFSTLLTAVKAAGLANTLQGDGPFTVFAPTDAAFAKLPPATLQSLLQPQNQQKLIDILTYHVVPGRVFADQAASAGQAPTVKGDPLTFELSNRMLMVEGVLVTAPDIDASNGVIHVIDEVLIPPTDG